MYLKYRSMECIQKFAMDGLFRMCGVGAFSAQKFGSFTQKQVDVFFTKIVFRPILIKICAFKTWLFY